MTSFYDSHDYYKKMLELQEKLRKSEEERIRLEERFKVLLQESRNRHNTCVNRLRFRYIEFLEEQRATDERNHKLLEALDRVDNSLALMTARTDRLNSLRKHYEAYLRGICTVHTDGVDGILGQQSDKYVRTKQRNSLPSEEKSTLPLQTSWSNYQQINSSFVSPSKSTKPTQNIFFDNTSSSNVDLRTPSQQINNNQSVSQTYPKHLQHDFEQLPAFHLSSPVRALLPVCQQSHKHNNNMRFEARDLQTDPKLQSLHVNTSMVRAVPHLSMPYYSNGNKPVDISPNQTSKSILQYPTNAARMQSFPLQQTSEAAFHHVQWKNDDFQNAPKSSERNVNFEMHPHANYLNRSFNNNEHDKSYITDTFQRYGNHFTARQLSKDTRETHTEKDQVILMTTDNEFDRYIDRIRKLHHDLDKQSFEEDRHWQDTNRALDANSTSSIATVLNNDSEISAREKSDESLTNKVKQVLELAENLVSRTMNMHETKSVERAEKAEENDCKLSRTIRSCTPVSERSHVEISDAREGRVTPTAHAKDKISNDIVLHEPELDSHKNIEKLKDQKFPYTDGTQEQREQYLPELQTDNSVHSSRDNKIYIADQSELEQFIVGEELVPWNLNYVEKQVQEIDVINDIELDETAGKDFIIEEAGSRALASSDENELKQIELDIGNNQLDRQEARDSESVQEVTLNDTSGIVKSQNKEYFEVNETKDNEISASELEVSEVKEDAGSLNSENSLKNLELPNIENMPNELSNMENIFENPELGDNNYVEQKVYDDNNDEKYNESNEQLDRNEDNKPANINEEHSTQDYNESHKAKEYPNLNTGHNYDQNESYEYDKKGEFEEYVDQEYPQEMNEQYEGYTSEQYDQYINNPENIYETDPNVEYQENTNEKYSYPYNSNQEFVADENQQYDPKEAEIPQEDEHKTKKEYDDEYTEDQKESKHQGEDVLEEVDEDQSEKLPSTNEKKKVKGVIKSLLDTDTDSTLEQNISTAESDFDFN